MKNDKNAEQSSVAWGVNIIFSWHEKCFPRDFSLEPREIVFEDLPVEVRTEIHQEFDRVSGQVKADGFELEETHHVWLKRVLGAGNPYFHIERLARPIAPNH